VRLCNAGPLRSRAAKAIGFIDDMINYSTANAPLQKELEAGKPHIMPSTISYSSSRYDRNDAMLWNRCGTASCECLLFVCTFNGFLHSVVLQV